MVDLTAGDPGAGESDPPGDAQQFPYKKQLKTLCVDIEYTDEHHECIVFHKKIESKSTLLSST
jgi:hypothetical protein